MKVKLYECARCGYVHETGKPKQRPKVPNIEYLPDGMSRPITDMGRRGLLPVGHWPGLEENLK